jgi:hypothetical protein
LSSRERERGRLKRPVRSRSGSPPAKMAAGDSILTGTPTFLLPTELVDDADRAGPQMAENGARAAGTPFISFYTPDENAGLGPRRRLQRHPIRARASLAERYFANRTDGLRPSSGEDLLVATI